MSGLRNGELFVEEKESMNWDIKLLRDLEFQITGAAIEVHKLLGPGLLESAYHKCMEIELAKRGISFISELTVPFNYKGTELITNLRCDFLIEDIITLEIKSSESITPIFEAQLLTYMRLLQSPKGLLINFNCLNIVKEGKRSLVNDLYANLREG